MEEEDVLQEAFFSPSDGEGATLQALFDAFSKAAELNPEPGEEAGEEPHGEGELVLDHGRCACVRARVRAHSLDPRFSFVDDRLCFFEHTHARDRMEECAASSS